jgi:cyclic-di-GMP phosphodiesterase TipF (flagellum assembly factor)
VPPIVHALFYLAYAIVAFAVALGLVQVGGADGAGATLGGIALFTACAITHAGLTVAGAGGQVRAMEKRLEKKIFGEIERIKTQQREMGADIEAMGDHVARLDHMVETQANRQIEARQAAPQIGMEGRLIETLVDKLGRAMDLKLDEVRRIAGAPPASASPRGPIDIVREALAENRVELHLQPIVSLPQRRTTFYEGFTRLKDSSGHVVMPNEFMPAADAAGLMSTIDNMLLFRCVQIVRRLSKQDRRIGIFCNISPRSLSDEGFFPQFLDFMLENRDLAGSLIFEIGQEAFEGRGAVEARAMSRLTDMGFRFSIDKVNRMAIDLIDLERSGVRYLKAPGHLLIKQLGEQSVRPRSNIVREIEARDVAAVFRRHNVDIIAERVEDEQTVVEILDLDIPFGQGHLFGTPRAIKDSLMEETAPPPGMFGAKRAVG